MRAQLLRAVQSLSPYISALAFRFYMEACSTIISRNFGAKRLLI